jgi:hypothetical protein
MYVQNSPQLQISAWSPQLQISAWISCWQNSITQGQCKINYTTDFHDISSDVMTALLEKVTLAKDIFAQRNCRNSNIEILYSLHLEVESLQKAYATGTIVH